MNFGLSGKTALVCAASRGLGRGCADALADEGVNLVILARRTELLEEAATQIRTRTGVHVETVACDITTPQGRELALAACPQPDILVNNAGGPRAGDFRGFTRQDWMHAIDGNMLTPIALIQSTIDGMIKRGFGRIINITSAAVKAPIGVLGLSNGARSGLTGFVAGLARQVAQHNVTINNLLPGLFDTDRLAQLTQAQAQAGNLSFQKTTDLQLQGIPAGRFGRIDEFGAACAFLCSVQAGYITGQNILLDGGAYPGVF
ncbi:SDR family oxidoreductase [Burkholderia lata]|uniref:SDR family oxidoreductase n=1 Tax=Burkholderia lata (strain ATCC 17760 / DSM 23089 / LMG 22485 / NCIMB 9086 / R18194 / 383) TaxID=482957 RepID=UPI0015826001|nr:SDR family oxidoreductase [Burkholderia lata]